MRGARDVLRRCRFRHRHVLERIKKLDRQLKFFVEKFARVRKACAAPAKKNARRRISLLLCSVMIDGAHQFCVQPGHGAARYFRDACNILIFWLSISAPQTDKTVPLLASFCRRERLIKFPGNCGSDRAAADGETARENSSRFDKEDVGR